MTGTFGCPKTLGVAMLYFNQNINTDEDRSKLASTLRALADQIEAANVTVTCVSIISGFEPDIVYPTHTVGRTLRTLELKYESGGYRLC